MRSLDPPDTHHLSAAQGWIDLGNPREAAGEWARLSATAREHPAALELLWRIQAEERQWPQALECAQRLLGLAPDNPTGWIQRSYALHELGRTSEAREKLVEAIRRFPVVSTIPYNLACYACRLGNLDEAREWLDRAVRLRSRKEIRAIALEDRDLESMWAEIRAWPAE